MHIGINSTDLNTDYLCEQGGVCQTQMHGSVVNQTLKFCLFFLCDIGSSNYSM